MFSNFFSLLLHSFKVFPIYIIFNFQIFLSNKFPNIFHIYKGAIININKYNNLKKTKAK
jgi:hypothetical protein